MTKKAITVSEFMESYSVGRSTAYELVRNPDFYPAFRIGRKVLISVEKLEQWLSEQNSNS